MRGKIYIFYNSLLLLWICLMYCIGVWLFSNGFLLIRKGIERKSCCDGSDHSLLSSTDAIVMSKTPGCGFANRYDRAVVLLIDELIFDFQLLNKTIDLNQNNESVLYSINNIYNKHSNHSKVYKLLKMPSLSSTQTLTSIITGGLQTFIELNTNFKPNHIIEDNLINQLNSKSKQTTLVTDISMKTSNINHLFNKTVYFSLDSEENDLKKKLVKEINSKDWDLLISQIPNIPHFQQLYGFKDMKTTNLLKQINGLIENIISIINTNNKTILFIISDSSDHKNTNLLLTQSSFVFTFSSQNLTSIESTFEEVKKIDLVPTISLLMGIPIPFSNMGKVMSALLEFPMDCKNLKPTPEFVCHEDISEIQSLWTSISGLRINVAQMQRYVTQSPFILPNIIQRQLDELLERYDRNWVLLNHIPSDDKLGTIASLKELRTNYEHYISQLTNHLNLNFGTFDNRFLCSGLIVLFLSCFANITAIYCLPSQQNLIHFCSKALMGGLMGALTANLIRVINFSFHERSVNDILFLSAVTSIVVSVGSVFVPKIMSFMSKNGHNFFSKLFSKNLMSFEVILITLSVLSSICFSKTLIRSEESVIHFIFQSLLILYLIDVNINKLSAIKSIHSKRLIFGMSLSLVLLNRLSKELHRCHEQQLICPHFQSILSLLTDDFLFSSFISILILFLIIYCLKECEFSDKLSLSNIFSKYLIVLSSISICGHLCLSLANPLIIEKLLSGNELSVAKTVLYCNAILITLLFLFPLQIDDRKDSNLGSNKRLFLSILMLSSSLFYSLLLFKDQTSNFGLILFSIFASIYSSLLNQIDSEISFVSIILWYLMAFNGFFTTGHYLSLDTIPSNILFTSQTTNFWSFITPIILKENSVWILSAISLSLFVLKGNKVQQKEYFWKSFSHILLKYVFLSGFTLSMSSLSCALMRNDLMIWRIFGLRFIHQMISLLITLLSVSFIYVFSLRVYLYSN